MDNANRIKMLEQVVASHERKLASAANKDQVRRQIAASRKMLKEERAR